MTHFIVTEGQSDKLLLTKLLQVLGRDEDVEIVVANGKKDVPSFARSLGLFENAPVLAVIDADTTDPTLIREQELNFNDLVTSVALTAPLELALAIPTLQEAINTNEFRKQLESFLKMNDLEDQTTFSFRR